MKKLVAALLVLSSVSSWAATDAEVIGAVFTDKNFVSTIGDNKVSSIQVLPMSSNGYEVQVNQDAPLSDGCSYIALVSAKKERFAVDIATTGVRTVLKVTHVAKSCGEGQ